MLFSGKPSGYDRVRNAEIGNKDFELDVLEEAYTTEHWLVRIYRVLPPHNKDKVRYTQRRIRGKTRRSPSSSSSRPGKKGSLKNKPQVLKGKPSKAK